MVFPDGAVAWVTKVGDMANVMELRAKLQESAGRYWARGSAELHYARKMFEAGALKLEAPQNMAAFLADIRRWGEVIVRAKIQRQ